MRLFNGLDLTKNVARIILLASLFGSQAFGSDKRDFESIERTIKSIREHIATKGFLRSQTTILWDLFSLLPGFNQEQVVLIESDVILVKGSEELEIKEVEESLRRYDFSYFGPVVSKNDAGQILIELVSNGLSDYDCECSNDSLRSRSVSIPWNFLRRGSRDKEATESVGEIYQDGERFYWIESDYKIDPADLKRIGYLHLMFSTKIFGRKANRSIPGGLGGLAQDSEENQTKSILACHVALKRYGITRMFRSDKSGKRLDIDIDIEMLSSGDYL